MALSKRLTPAELDARIVEHHRLIEEGHRWIRETANGGAPADERRAAAKQIEKWNALAELARVQRINDIEESRKVSTAKPIATKTPAPRTLVDADAPRIVCTTCPAVAKIHYYKTTSEGRLGEADRLTWVECHGQHWFGTMSAYTVSKATADKRDLLIQDINVWEQTAIEKALRNAASDIRTGAAKLWLFQGVVAKKIAAFEWRAIVRDAFLDGRDDEAIAMICTELGLERPRYVEPGARRGS